MELKMSSYTVSISRELTIDKSEYFSRAVKVFAFTLFMILGAKVDILTQPVPITLQTFFVILSGAFLGKKDGMISQLLYLFIGLAGLPVFAGPFAGIAKIIGPTGGYLLAFPLAAFLTGWMLELNIGILKTFLSMFFGVGVIYLFGVLHLNIFYLHNLQNSLVAGLAVFSVWELVKIVCAVMIYKKLKSR
jgi:biotin transport system substrate-specific component